MSASDPARAHRTPLSRLPRNVKTITATRVLGATGFSSTIQFLALCLAVERSTPLAAVGAVPLLQAVAGLGSQVVSGLTSDRVGARRTYPFGNTSAVAAAELGGDGRRARTPGRLTTCHPRLVPRLREGERTT
jgi:hypothetical protein